MSKRLLKQLPIPRRARSCARSNQPFQPGDTVVSLISDGQKEGVYEREDILQSEWDEQPGEGVRSYWTSVIPERAKKPTTPDEYLERAMTLLVDFLDKEEAQLKAFLLALFLGRKKKLIFRGELREEGTDYYLFEVEESEEMLTLPVLDPSEAELARVQQELSDEIGSLS